MSMHEQKVEARRVAATIPKALGHCADILDRFPCVQCGTSRPKDCPVSRGDAVRISRLINDTPYLGHVLRLEADRRRKEAP